MSTTIKLSAYLTEHPRNACEQRGQKAASTEKETFVAASPVTNTADSKLYVYRVLSSS